MLSEEEVERRLRFSHYKQSSEFWAVKLLQALETARDLYAENERLVKFNQDTVSKIAEGRLDGYRELGQRAADAETKCDALKQRVGELLSDAQLRLQIATDAKPSNIRLGQARELRWWVNRLSALAALSKPEGDG